MRKYFFLLLPLFIAAAPGCQWLVKLDQSRSVDLARRHDAECITRGYAYPSEAYIECRRILMDSHQREQWQELQMSRQQGQGEIGVVPGSAVEPYRPIPAHRFRCEQITGGDGSYIRCGETD